MSIDVDRLYSLLPALYRERDAENGEVLRQYLEVLTDELAVVADGIDQLHDDLFVETAAPWVLPYLADLVGLRGVPGAATAGLTPRAEVANTIAYRRRKGTAAVLEQVARDTTGWPARAVEFFELLATCQNVNHVRPRNRVTVSVRDANRMEFVGTAFERGRTDREPDLVHLPEMRRIATRRGRYNVPDVGIFLWQLRPYPATGIPARPAVAGGRRRFLLDPLGAPLPLFTLPVPEADITHLAEPIDVPLPIGRRLMAANPAAYYGSRLSVELFVPVPGDDPEPVPLDRIDVCDLRDLPDGSGRWAHTPVPEGRVRLDPVLGRVAFGDAPAAAPVATYHRGFSADLGGGEYDRVSTFTAGDPRPLVSVSATGPADHDTIAAAVAAIGPGGGIVEIRDSATYTEALVLSADAGRVELRAADERRPTVLLSADLRVALSAGGEVTLNGLVLASGAVRAVGEGRLVLRHCTLVPGLDRDRAGEPVHPGTPSLHVDDGGVSAVVERCILGGVRCHTDADASFTDCILDAGETGIAYTGPAAGGYAGPSSGGRLRVDECTVVGRVRARIMDRLSNSVVLAGVPVGEGASWPAPVLTEQRQHGCVRFSYLPPGSRTPRRYRCVPPPGVITAGTRPMLASARFGDPTYGRLDRRTPDSVWRGADDESEMGAFHHLQQPRREAYLEARLADYLRFGLDVGLFPTT